MSDTLLLAGIAILVAVVLGGGLSIFGVNIPVIDSWPRRGLLTVIGVGLIAGGIAVRESDESAVEVAGIGFVREKREDGSVLGLPDIMVQLRNTGTKVALVTRVEVAVKQSWELLPTAYAAMTGFKTASQTYDADIALGSLPHVDVVSVSQELNPDSADRFDLTLSLSGNDEKKDYVLLMNVTIFYDKRQATSTSNDFLVVTSDPRHGYFSSKPGEPAAAQSAHNQSVLEQIRRLDAQQSDELEGLMRKLLP